MLFSRPLMFREAKELAAWIFFSYSYAKVISETPFRHNKLIMSLRVENGGPAS